MERLVLEPSVERLFQRGISRINAQLSRHEAVRGFHLLDTAFTTEDSLLTPSLKVRRQQVLERYAAEIEALYATGDSMTHDRATVNSVP